MGIWYLKKKSIFGVELDQYVFRNYLLTFGIELERYLEVIHVSHGVLKKSLCEHTIYFYLSVFVRGTTSKGSINIGMLSVNFLFCFRKNR